VNGNTVAEAQQHNKVAAVMPSNKHGNFIIQTIVAVSVQQLFTNYSIQQL
jgi:hypothetical protein